MSFMQTRLYFDQVCTLCQNMYDFYKLRGLLAACIIDADPIKTFEEVKVSLNPFRLIPFILWLKYRPTSFSDFR